MKDYQKKTISDLTELYEQINNLDVPTTDMVTRLQNVKRFRNAARLEESAMRIAAYSHAYNLAKKYLDDVITPVLNELDILKKIGVSIKETGSITLNAGYYHGSFDILADFEYPKNTQKNFTETHFKKFKLGFDYETYTTKDLSFFNQFFEKWIERQL